MKNAIETVATATQNKGQYIVLHEDKVYVCDEHGTRGHSVIVNKNSGKPFAIIQGMKGANGAKHIGLCKLTKDVPYQLNEKASSHISLLKPDELAKYIVLTEEVYELEELAKSRTQYKEKTKKLEDYTIEELKAYITSMKSKQA